MTLSRRLPSILFIGLLTTTALLGISLYNNSQLHSWLEDYEDTVYQCFDILENYRDLVADLELRIAAYEELLGATIIDIKPKNDTN